jgi:hypothetical protein
METGLEVARLLDLYETFGRAVVAINDEDPDLARELMQQAAIRHGPENLLAVTHQVLDGDTPNPIDRAHWEAWLLGLHIRL